MAWKNMPPDIWMEKMWKHYTWTDLIMKLMPNSQNGLNGAIWICHQIYFMDGKNVKELHLNGFDYETDTKHCQNVLSHGAGWL